MWLPGSWVWFSINNLLKTGAFWGLNHGFVVEWSLLNEDYIVLYCLFYFILIPFVDLSGGQDDGADKMIAALVIALSTLSICLY